MNAEDNLFPKLVDDPGPIREIVQAVVASVASSTFFLVVWFYLAQATEGSDVPWQHAETSMHSVLPAATSVLGTALGFYFGSQKR